VEYSNKALNDAVERRDEQTVMALIEASPLDARAALVQLGERAKGHAESRNIEITEARADSFAGRIDRATYEYELAEYKRWLHGNKRFISWVGRYITEAQNAQTRARARAHQENEATTAGRLADAIRAHARAAREVDAVPTERDLMLWAEIGIKPRLQNPASPL
jgi:hypothetical protein